MNFGTVRIIRRGLRRGESGQAFTELAVSLIAFLAVFVGFLLIAALSTDQVTYLIRAREEADRASRGGFITADGESIRYWDYGSDEIPFTTDDRAIPGAAGDGAFFRWQLTDNTGFVTLQNPPSSSTLASDFSSLQDSNFFVNAATLTEGEIHSFNTLRDHNIESLESAISWLFHIDGTSVGDSVYMPAHISRQDD